MRLFFDDPIGSPASGLTLDISELKKWQNKANGNANSANRGQAPFA